MKRVGKRTWVTMGIGLLALGAVAALSSCRTPRDASNTPEVVERVDLDRYLGTWFEIASFPKSFQEGCHATTATYSMRDDGDIRVMNSCRKGSLDGEVDEAEGKAWVVDETTNAKLKVQFFWPFRGDYWVLELGEDYEYAVVGSPDRDSLWILNRERQMDPQRYQDIVDRFEQRGWEMSRLRRTPQPQQ